MITINMLLKQQIYKCFQVNKTYTKSLLRSKRRNLLCECKQLQLKNFFRTNSSVASIYSEDDNRAQWKSIVGLEIHAQINAKSKLFSGAGTVFGAPTNTQVSYFDAAVPGTLPVLNEFCVRAGILTALALNCSINKISTFDRKHYFYPDLPAGYQITQQFQPLATNGYLDFIVYDKDQGIKPYACKARLKQLQLEQDSGRSFHMDSGKTLIDLNRAGIGLMELVFEPDLKNGLEAAMLVKELQLILKKLGTCTCIMQEGALRVDANISVHKHGEPWGVRTEVKNINSFRFIAQAIDYEINRHIEILENGGSIANETLTFDYKAKKTIFMRDKEEHQDYRYMPEPNLPPIQVYDSKEDSCYTSCTHTVNIDEIRKQIPVLPVEERQQLMTKYNVSYEDADRIVNEEGLLELYTKIASSGCDPLYLVQFVLSPLKYHLNSRKLNYRNCPVSYNQLKEIVEMMDKKVISEATVDDILEMLFNGDSRSAEQIVKTYNWFLISDEQELEALCHQVMLQYLKVVKKYQKSKKQWDMNTLVKALLKMTNNRVSFTKAQEIFVKLIMHSGDKKCIK